jgi:hypothetical protein
MLVNIGKIFKKATFSLATFSLATLCGCSKILQMAIKYINIFQSKALQKLPKLRFWFDNKPSGNPDINPKCES